MLPEIPVLGKFQEHRQRLFAHVMLHSSASRRAISGLTPIASRKFSTI
jgi:hypothetical protein